MREIILKTTYFFQKNAEKFTEKVLESTFVFLSVHILVIKY